MGNLEDGFAPYEIRFTKEQITLMRGKGYAFLNPPLERGRLLRFARNDNKDGQSFNFDDWC